MKRAEPPLLIFISSVMGIEDLGDERDAAVRIIDSLLLSRAWAFEFSPASSDPVDQTYLEKVDQCDIFILILGVEITTAVRDEYERAVAGVKPRLLFVKNGQRTASAAEWLGQRQDVKWARFDTPEDLAQHVKAAVCDELIKAHRRLHLREKDFEAI